MCFNVVLASVKSVFGRIDLQFHFDFRKEKYITSAQNDKNDNECTLSKAEGHINNRG